MFRNGYFYQKNVSICGLLHYKLLFITKFKIFRIKKTTPGQFRILVESMDEFPELATSTPIFGKSKADIEAKWDVVAQKVNSAGPPMRSGSDWKRVR